MAIVRWDYEDFLGYYPQLSDINEAQLEAAWQTVNSIVDNSDGSRIPYAPEREVYVRKVLLYSLMCHILSMSSWSSADGSAGTLASVSEGSVSASFNIPQVPGGGVSSVWLNQTPCGRNALMIIRRYSLGGRYYGMKTFHPYG